MTPLKTADQFEAFSPRIAMTLIVGDERIHVRSTCDTSISVETDRSIPAGDAVLEMTVGDETDETQIRLLDGIDPSREEQPIRVLSIT